MPVIKRPPHRPSRRAAIIDAAMGLCAVHPPERVTVADIAAASDMTAAAVYYHFPSKEYVLLEGLQLFSGEMLAAMREMAKSPDAVAWARQLMTSLLEWLEQNRSSATVYFAHSAGVDAAIEALRRQTRIAQVGILARAIRIHSRASRSSVDPEVAAIGLIALIEHGACSWLTHDAVFLGLGRRGFIGEMGMLAERLVSAPATASTAD